MNKPSVVPSPTYNSFKPITSSDNAAPADLHTVTPDAKGQPANVADTQIKSRPQQEQQQQMSVPSVDELKGKWKQHVGAAKIAWGKLTEDEFLQLEGQEQKLTGLVQERYAITRDEADKQVKAFFDKIKS